MDGDESIIERENNLATKGAGALILYKDQPGMFFGKLKDESANEPKIPVVSVTREDGLLLRQLAKNGNTVTLTPDGDSQTSLNLSIDSFKTVNLEIGNYKVWFYNEGHGSAEVTLNYTSNSSQN